MDDVLGPMLAIGSAAHVAACGARFRRGAFADAYGNLAVIAVLGLVACIRVGWSA